MEPLGTPVLTGYSCEDFPYRTTRSRLLLRKEVCEEDQHAKPCRKLSIF